MRSGALVAFLILGVAAYLYWNRSRGSTGASAVPSTTAANGYSPTPLSPDRGPTGGADALQRSIDQLASSISAQSTKAGVAAGAVAGGAAGGGVGAAVSTGENGLARGLGSVSLTDAQIAALERNASSNGLGAGATSGANVGSLVGGFAGGLFSLFPGFGKAAAVPLADATPTQPTGGKSLYDVPFFGGLYHGSDALFGGRP